ncbi:hypothetical protein ACFQXA_34060 [Nocardiopsis composta]
MTLLAAGAALLVVVGAGGFVTRTYLLPADYDGAGSGEVEVVVPEGPPARRSATSWRRPAWSPAPGRSSTRWTAGRTPAPAPT